ncbi:MAG: IS256 family transposase [Deltaproteobacteria bacterium]|nr:MAG: IS256 family transposase [Deltaproteobacteria bacterium]
MTHCKENNAIEQMMEAIIENGMEGLESAISILINEAMKVERSRVLGAEPWQRSEHRRGYANGYKPRSLSTRVGKLSLRVPQVRGDVTFYPSALERGLRSERALKLAIAEMYVQGVSTRKVAEVMERLCGLDVTSNEVSRCASLLDEELEKWRARPLGHCPYLVLDARYENVRIDGTVRSCAVLIAAGVREDGKRSILGVSCSMSEAEVHWRDFLSDLKKRGLHGVEMITSDDHEGLKAALKATFHGVAWNRCHFHLQQNAAAYVPKVAMRAKVTEDIRTILTAPSREEAERLLDLAVKKYAKSAPRLSVWIQSALPEGFTVLGLPRRYRQRLRTTNMLERVNKEIKRRTRVATLFPNEKSLLRLVSAILMEISEDWETGKAYLKLEEN